MKKNVAEFLGFHFEKLKLLKRSERGEVWLASKRQSGELVIIKRVASTGLPYNVLKNFSFKLPAKVLYCAEDAKETIIVEEFIQGENLLERLEGKNFFSEVEAREILIQMCDGLSELHEQKIIHRDIKPSNMILQGGRIRLIDFDAARIFKDDKDADTELLGTKGYAPPEQFGSSQTDPRSDIYSLGITIKNLLGGNCGGRLKKILDKCTELDPKNRFQSVDELKSALLIEEPPAHRKFHAALIFFVTAGIFFVNVPTLNSNENFSEKIISRPAELPAENISAQEKISKPAQVEPFKFPEIVLPPQNNPPAPNFPAPPEKNNPPQRKISSGLLKTEFYLNGVLYNQAEHKNDREKISRADWQRSQVRLHITNDTGEIWQNPEIEIIFGQNWGGDPLTTTKSLPALNVGESADFVIAFDIYPLSDNERLSASLQIYLRGDESKTDEHYWCVWFDIID